MSYVSEAVCVVAMRLRLCCKGRFLHVLNSLQIAACALMSAASATLAVAMIARHGQSNNEWNTICNLVSRFCDYAQGAVIASFCGFAFLALSTLLDASALHHLSWH